MLNILRVEPLAEADVEINDYIPFKVRFRKEIVSAPLVWAIGDTKSLLNSSKLERQ
ncbi:MAG TPA: hypothetical protein VNK04_02650 [Gemmataceae bacterium]|nr:hypothetical protein [Gemmataceae bacterium]